HVKFSTLLYPFSTSSLYNFLSAKTSSIVLANSISSLGLNINAASPTTSGNEDELEHITGVPQAIDSKTGIPKPSYKDGNINKSAKLYKSTNSSSLTIPVCIINSFNPNLSDKISNSLYSSKPLPLKINL